jgi:hypothetical protein
VKVNKIKRYFRKTAEPPSALAYGDDEGQDVINDDDVTSSAAYDHFDAASDLHPVPPAMTEEATEDQSHDPKWEPSRHHETQIRPHSATEIGKETGIDTD